MADHTGNERTTYSKDQPHHTLYKTIGWSVLNFSFRFTLVPKEAQRILTLRKHNTCKISVHKYITSFLFSFDWYETYKDMLFECLRFSRKCWSLLQNINGVNVLCLFSYWEFGAQSSFPKEHDSVLSRVILYPECT